MLGRQQDIVRRLRQVHRRRITVVLSEREHSMHLGIDGPLAPHGRNGYGPVCRLHSFRAIT